MAEGEETPAPKQKKPPVQIKTVQATPLISSDVSLQVGLEVYSKTDLEKFWKVNHMALKEAACNEIYQSSTSKESQRLRAEMARKGVDFVKPDAVDWASAPRTWEVESFKTTRNGAGPVQIILRRRRDEYSYNRLTVTHSEFINTFSTCTLDEYLDRQLEQTRSMWAKKSALIQQGDQIRVTERIIERTADPLQAAASEIARFESMTRHEQTSAMQDNAFRSKLLKAKQVVSAVQAFA